MYNALSPNFINGAIDNEVGAAVIAEIETGMNLGWRRRRGKSQLSTNPKSG
jgi:hypothetical protein